MAEHEIGARVKPDTRNLTKRMDNNTTMMELWLALRESPYSWVLVAITKDTQAAARLRVFYDMKHRDNPPRKLETFTRKTRPDYSGRVAGYEIWARINPNDES